jgi:hypothetical protein
MNKVKRHKELSSRKNCKAHTLLSRRTNFFIPRRRPIKIKKLIRLQQSLAVPQVLVKARLNLLPSRKLVNKQ